MVTRRTALAVIGSAVGIPGIATAEMIPTPDPDGPEVLEMSQSDPSIPNDGVTVTARVHDPHGELDRIAFGEGRNEMTVDEISVSGSTAEAAYEFDEVPRHIRSGYPTLAWGVSTDGRVGEIGRLDPPEVYVPIRAQFESVNDPVDAGDHLTATISVENLGNMQDIGPLPDLQLVAGEVVDTKSIDVPHAQQTTVQMGYETFPVQNDVEFTLRLVAGDTVADTRTVSVHA